jgi:amino acid adenylation domain-containing protein
VEQSRQVSFGQQRLWFLEQLEPENGAYNLASAIRITGILEIEALERALQTIVQRHDSLRTTFRTVEGQVMALVCAAPEPLELPQVSLDHLPEDQGEEEALLLAAEEGRRPFDLSGGPLMRVKLLRLSPAVHMLVLTMHHIIMDGSSIGALLKEMAGFYEAFHSNRSPEVPALTIQYGDFAVWQRESFIEVQARQLEYWKQTLSGAPAVLELPADRPRPAVQSHKGHRYSVRLDAELARDVVELSRKERATPFMVLLAAFETLLWRYTGVADFVLGTPMAGRSHVELEPLIGLFVNTIAMRADLSGNPTFRALLQRVREKTINAMAHQDAPFEKVVEELRPERSMSHTPLFQTMFIMHNSPRTSLDFAGLHLDELELDSGLAKFDLTVETMFESDELCCSWEYSTDLFDPARIARMAQHFETLLRGICADPGRALSELPVLDAKERNKVLVEWNATQSAFPDDVCIHEGFEVRAARSANSPAVRSDDRNLTFQQLNDEANCLAHYLRRLGVQTRDRVGVAVERSADAIVALLAVLKAGASYVPIDPAYPKQRIDFMLKDSGARVLITQHRLRMRLPEHSGQTVLLDRDRASIVAESCLNPGVALDCRCPAYVIYTSGSTGNPKGVLGTHRASMNRFAWMWKAYPFREDEVCAQRTSLSFVDSVAEIFGPLLQGVPIFVIPDESVIDTDELVRLLATRGITRIVVVPSQLSAMLDVCPPAGTWLPTLRFCFTSGEALPYTLYERFRKLVPHAALVNLYGSSEVAADVTCFDPTSASPRGFVPIGKPIANVRVYLLDPYLNPVPIGVPGEIHVAGDCLAQGYLDRPELTAERFIADPFCPGSGGVLYKTGDLGRFHENGDIEFLGRRDNQVKIRGLRIELGEIETSLRTHDTVRHAAVLVRNDGAANQIIAYVVPAEGREVVPSELRRHLKTKLPDYMVPSAFLTIDALPMTPNGKLDQRALPVFDPARRQTAEGYVGPRNELEGTLVEIWAEVLKVERIGVLDNFFELGGHSLLAAQVIARIRKYVGVEVPVRNLFEEPTVAALAPAVERARAGGATAGTQIVPRSSVRQTREELESRLRELSDEEVDRLLTTALAHRARGEQRAN